MSANTVAQKKKLGVFSSSSVNLTSTSIEYYMGIWIAVSSVAG